MIMYYISYFQTYMRIIMHLRVCAATVNSISAERRVNIVFLGDLVGYYSVDPRMLALFEEMIEHYNLKLLLGNHDAKFLNTYFGADYQVNCEIPFYGINYE